MSRRLHPLNQKVGAKVRERRILLGMSQRQLADAIGVTFQQVQKYENGTNRIDAARLAALSRALNVPPQWFFQDLGDTLAPAAPALLFDIADDDEIARRDTMTLIRAFNRIRSAEKRDCLVALLQAIGDAEERDRAVVDR